MQVWSSESGFRGKNISVHIITVKMVFINTDDILHVGTSQHHQGRVIDGKEKKSWNGSLGNPTLKSWEMRRN